ncbi:MAG: undecaprenyl-diphosphate phosphatase, partial [Clostridia bacterium]|nr:undecaprenyl-diphosphate phosphatase [Clostridia bacterium]
TAVLLITTEFLLKNKKVTCGGIDGKKALIMGIAQSVAVIPGISRSGSTICAGLIAEGDRENVAKFSFLMSIPIILGSSVVSVFEFEAASYNVFPLLIAMLAAFFSAFFAIKVMMKVIQKVNFKWFSLYLFALSVLVFIDSFVYNIW